MHKFQKEISTLGLMERLLSINRARFWGFESEAAVQKVFYLRIRELKQSWDLKPIPGWVAVRNQLAMYEPLCKRIRAHLPQWC